jgi:hypothetical protein
MAEVVSLHAIAGAAGQWCAIRLADGSSDKTAYPSRPAAYSHNWSRPHFTILVPPGGMTAREAEEVLHYHRELHEKLGNRAAELPVLMPLTRPDRRRQIQALAKGRL